MIDLSGKVALVTGAGSGFGEGIAKLMAELGATVVGGDIDEGSASRVAGEVADAGGKMDALGMDVRKGDDFERAADHAVRQHGSLDVLVNNAGWTHRSMPMLEVDEKSFDKVMETNVKSIYHSAIRVVPRMVAQGGGSVVNVASTAGVRPRGGITWYNGSKGAVVILTKSMAVELAKDKVRVNAVNPVMGETGMLDDLLGGDSQMKRDFVTSNIPMGRLSQPADIARAVAFLASDAASFITGSTIEVDGGRCV